MIFRSPFSRRQDEKCVQRRVKKGNAMGSLGEFGAYFYVVSFGKVLAEKKNCRLRNGGPVLVQIFPRLNSRRVFIPAQESVVLGTRHRGD